MPAVQRALRVKDSLDVMKLEMKDKDSLIVEKTLALVNCDSMVAKTGRIIVAKDAQIAGYKKENQILARQFSLQQAITTAVKLDLRRANIKLATIGGVTISAVVAIVFILIKK